MLPPRYTVFPSSVLRMDHIPVYLRWTYLILYALAWKTDYQWLDETYQQLSATFTALEGEEISPEGIRQRFRRLAEFGLIERRGAGSNYRTYLLIRHDQVGGLGVSTTYAKQEERDQLGVSGETHQSQLGVSREIHPIKNRTIVVVDDTESEEQQQQYSNGSANDVERNEQLLAAMGIVGRPRYRLAREIWVTPDYLETIMAYRAEQAAKGNVLGPGWVVRFVGEQGELPEAEPGRYRYIRGKYKDYVKR